MLNKEEIRKNFSLSAPEYEEHAKLQKELADELFQSVQSLQPLRILDIGCGTGYLARRLAEHFPKARVIGVDIAPGMIEVAGGKNSRKNLTFEIGDGETLSFPKGSFDLVVSNASLQWMDAQKVFQTVLKILKPKGHFVFTTFGPQTLFELKESGFQVNRFISVEEIKELIGSRFSIDKLDSKMAVQKFQSVKELVYHLKEIGAQSVNSPPRPGQNVLQALRRYKENYWEGKNVTATYEIIFGKIYT